MTTFAAPDSGSDRTPYCCSIHTVPLPDERVLLADVIRNGDAWILRVFCIEPDGKIHGVVSEEPDFLIRKGNRIEGGAHHYGLDLELTVDGEVRDTGWAYSLGAVNLAARDYLMVRYRDAAWIGNSRYAVSSPGTASVHYGRFLPQYGYLVALRSSLLVAATGRDNFAWWSPVKRMTYSYYTVGVGLSKEPWGPAYVPIGNGCRLLLSVLSRFDHLLLGLPTVTAVADARVIDAKGAHADIGRVIVDCRGEQFTGALR